MYAQFLSILGPYQQDQRRVQLSPEELHQSLSTLESTKEVLQFNKLFLTSMQLSCPENVERDDFSNIVIFKEEQKNCIELINKKTKKNIKIHKNYFLFIIKYFLVWNFTKYEYDTNMFSFLTQEEKEKLFSTQTSLQNNQFQTKSYFIQCLKDEIHEKFQDCLNVCKYENESTKNVSHEILQNEIKNQCNILIYFICGLYNQNYLECLLKLKNLNITCKRIYENEEKETENIEYNILELKNFYKKLINIENILSLGVLETIHPFICIYYIQKL